MTKQGQREAAAILDRLARLIAEGEVTAAAGLAAPALSLS
jgi:hypothetical protein